MYTYIIHANLLRTKKSVNKQELPNLHNYGFKNTIVLSHIIDIIMKLHVFYNCLKSTF